MTRSDQAALTVPALKIDPTAFAPLTAERKAEVAILVAERVINFYNTYRTKRLKEMQAGGGLLNKLGNILYESFTFRYAALSSISRSFDSSLGLVVQELVIELARRSYGCENVLDGEANKLAGVLTSAQRDAIDTMLKAGARANPSRNVPKKDSGARSCTRRGDLLIKRDNAPPVFFEIKMGGQLDDKKASAEKRGALEYCALYANKYGVTPALVLGVLFDSKEGSGQAWSSGPVRKFFSEEELLVARQFWNFILNASDGYDVFTQCWVRESVRLSDMVHEIEDEFVRLADARDAAKLAAKEAARQVANDDSQEFDKHEIAAAAGSESLPPPAEPIAALAVVPAGAGQFAQTPSQTPAHAVRVARKAVAAFSSVEAGGHSSRSSPAQAAPTALRPARLKARPYTANQRFVKA